MGAHVSVTVKAKGPVTVRTASAEFEILPDGCVRGYPDNQNPGAVDAYHPRIAVEFTGSLPLEVTRQ